MIAEAGFHVESTVPLPQPIVFGPAERPLAGFVHVPREGQRATGIVLCNPIGYEAMCTHRTYGALAQRLAARGFACIRFDYDGTGNSAGRFGDPARVRAWQEGIDAAIDALRSTTGVQRVGLFGVRFGATLAAVVSREREDVESFVGWAPAVSGRAYVREMRAFRMIQAAKLPTSTSTSGVEEVAGYPFDAETLASMSAFDLTSDPRPVAGRVLLLTRDDLPGSEERLAGHLRAGGATVQLEREPGYAAMMRDPQESVVPVKALETIVAWLEANTGASEARPTPPAAPSSTIRSPSFEEALAFFPGRDAGLFGVLTAPTASTAARDRPAILFLNVGANHHVGPNRMYVLLARDLAARGYTSMRFDVAGLGDSPAPPGSGEVRLYSKDSVADVKAAMTFLGETRGARRFVLVGVVLGCVSRLPHGHRGPARRRADPAQPTDVRVEGGRLAGALGPSQLPVDASLRAGAPGSHRVATDAAG